MKRLPQTLTAAVLTGALAFGGAAVAQAEEENYQFEQQDITQNLEQQDITQNLVEGDDSHVEGAENYNPEAKDAESEDDSDAADESDASGKVERHDKEQQDTSAIPGAATKTLEDGTVCYQHIQDKSVYVEDSNEVNTEITDETVGKCKDANAGATDPEGSSELSNAAKAAIGAAIALPILGGIVHYFLNKDGKTWVKSQDRVNAEPTPEEKAESEKIVAEHKDEINAQLAEQAQGNNAEGTAPAAGESADSARGMSAETGSNSVAQALAALAVAAMVAAGAFAARRKFFA
ncbi:hypothetical protein MHK10_11815 [Corynebacterium striatum]|uniref:hypothetical protein n=1 Tax=Corynebacterium striatum TaxID=43770 RepID=UPI001EF49BD6|nr:hypothetical protein [Corynebacterium striatum]MCG7250971.1 hypothetical protein [Corynebacterium striatum]